jgi:hypothetical protein
VEPIASAVVEHRARRVGCVYLLCSIDVESLPFCRLAPRRLHGHRKLLKLLHLSSNLIFALQPQQIVTMSPRVAAIERIQLK